MDMSLGRPRFSWPVTGSTPTPRSIRFSHRSLRVLTVFALYGITVFAIHGLATDFRAHSTVASSNTGMCHRH